MNKNEIIFCCGYKYLRNIGATETEIRRHLCDWYYRKPKEIDGKDGLFYKMIEHARNRQRMSNTLDYKPKSKSDINYKPNPDHNFCYLTEVLYDFDSKKVLNEYRYYESELHLRNNIEKGIAELLKIHQNNSKLKKLHESIKKNITDSENNKTWVNFSKSIISIAEFLSKFNTIDDFKKFVDQFDANDDTRIYLALLLRNEIFGYGFALACDFLKENCNQKYVKPDTHIKYFFDELKLYEKKPASKNEDIEYYKAIMEFCNSIHETPYETDKALPYEVDKLFWLIGSSDFYRLDDERKKQIKTNRKEFVNYVNSKMNNMTC